MQKHFVYLFFLLSFLPISLTRGQGNLATGTTSVLYPSPTAASLGKFTEVPVSLYTGVPSVSVPIWQIQRGDINVDVALSYHSGGIRVDEIASWAGLGWALQAGGMITCSTRGLPDDPGSYASVTMPLLNRYMGAASPPMSALERGNYVRGVIGGVYDSEPDLYSLSIGGIACQFFMNKDGNFVSTSRELNLKIEYHVLDAHGTRYTWMITDGKGVQYKFLAAEHVVTTPFSFGIAGTSNTTGSTFDGDVSWGLNEIEDTQGNVVRFQYAHDGNSFGNIASEYITTVSFAETGDLRCIGKEDRGYTYVETQGSALRLTSITCGQEEVRFEAAPAERQDLASAHALRRIVISYAGRAKRAFQFYTHYTSATTVGTRGTYYPDVHNQSRLQLDSLREESADGLLVKPAYAFAYYAGQLPYRSSAAQDHWGYFNGQDNRTRVGYRLAGQRLGAQKAPLFAAGLIGNLASIRYPTGGTAQFTYESNQYRRNPADAPLPLDSTFAQVTVETVNGLDGNSPGDALGYEAQQTFELTPAMMPRARGSLPIQLVQHQLVDAAPVGQQNGFTVIMFAYRVGSIATPIRFGMIPDSGMIAHLTPGRYTLFVQIEKEFPWQQDPRTIHMDASLSADITTSAFAVNRVYNGPGLRIKQLQKTFGTGPAEITTYDYTDPATGTSSGLLANTPNYGQHKIVRFLWENANDMGTYSCGCDKYTSNSNYPLVNTRSSYVGYSHVAEYRGGSSAQGFKAFDFTNFDRYNDLNATPVFPYPPVTSHESRRGLVVREQTFAGPSSASVPLQRVQVDSTNYDELSGSLDWADGLKMADGNNMGSLTNNEDVSVQTDSYYTTAVAFYRLEAGSFQQQNKTSSLLANGKPFNTTRGYQYTPDTFLPNRITSTTSDGARIVQRLYYPTDYRANARRAPLLAGLLAANRVTVPLEQSTLRSDGLTAQLTSGTIHEYGLVVAPDGYRRFYLKKIYAANTAASDTSSHYTGVGLPAYYEEKARVLKITGHNQPVVEQNNRYQVSSYLWGYEDRYPIASCSNATDAEVFHEGFEESTTAVTGAAHAGTKYFPGAYTINWARPNTRAYVLRYWFRQRGSWRYRQVPYTGTGITLTDGDAYDDVSIYPQDAQLTTSTYDPLVGMTSQTDPSGRTTTYEYDGLGRLVRTRDDQHRVLSQQQYHAVR